jgi:hypothetical protein
MPSNQINRFTLATRLRERAKELGIEIIDGTVTDVSIRDAGHNQIIYTGDW